MTMGTDLDRSWVRLNPNKNVNKNVKNVPPHPHPPPEPNQAHPLACYHIIIISYHILILVNDDTMI